MQPITTQKCLRPLLVALSSVPHLQINDAVARVGELLNLSQAERQERLAGSTTTYLRHRCGWARTALNRAGLVEPVSRGVWRITEAGRAALQQFPVEITDADLAAHYPAFKEWIKQIAERARAKRAGGEEESGDGAPPVAADEEIFASADEQMLSLERRARALIEDAVLERLQVMQWARFEALVEQLVIKLGYGTSEDEVTAALRGGADEGVDGVINEDRLGLGQIYLQAKRWQNQVGRPDIQKFVGAMHGRALRGVFITTSDFSRDARGYADSVHGLRLRLIGGRELASLMVDCGLGVNEARVFRTYRIDSDFFSESEE